MTVASPIDLDKYILWFVWVRATLNRQLEASHAAAEAAYHAESAGLARDEVEAAAARAGDSPSELDAETVAIAEWAAWAQEQHKASPAASLVVARVSVALVDATHDLDRATREASSALAAERMQDAGRRINTRVLWTAGSVAVGLVVIAAIAAGLMNMSRPKVGEPTPSPKAVVTVTVAEDPSSSEATVMATGLPPNRQIYVFVGDTWEKIEQTDATGSLTTTVDIPRGGTPVSVCLDTWGTDCPASTFVTRP